MSWSIPDPKVRGGLAALLIVVAPLVMGGCGDGNPFVPPPPAELSALADPKSAPSATPSISLILGPESSTQRDEWVQAARLEAAKSRVYFTVLRQLPTDSSKRQADLIRAALRSDVVIVEPVDDPAVGEAIREVRGKGQKVLLAGRGVPIPGQEGPIPAVAFAPFEESARRLVAAAFKEAKESGLPDQGRHRSRAAGRADRSRREGGRRPRGRHFPVQGRLHGRLEDDPGADQGRSEDHHSLDRRPGGPHGGRGRHRSAQGDAVVQPGGRRVA
jgi:hypothetical protein